MHIASTVRDADVETTDASSSSVGQTRRALRLESVLYIWAVYKGFFR